MPRSEVINVSFNRLVRLDIVITNIYIIQTLRDTVACNIESILIEVYYLFKIYIFCFQILDNILKLYCSDINNMDLN